MEDIIKVAAVCMKSNYVPPISDSGYSSSEIESNSPESRERREEAQPNGGNHLDWLEDKDQWEILNQFVWYQAQTVLMEIYRRDGNYKTRKNGQPRKTCQDIGDKIVSFFWHRRNKFE